MIELLAVIATAAILIILLFAGWSQISLNSKQTACLNNMRVVGAATLAYAGDHNGYFPLKENAAWDIPLSTYLNVSAPTTPIPMLKCPQDSRPLVDSAGRFARSYSFNKLLPEKIQQIPLAAQTIMIAEWYTGDGGAPGGASENFQYQGDYNVVAYSREGVPTNKGMSGYHQKFSNFLYADAHAKSVAPLITVTKALWVVKQD